MLSSRVRCGAAWRDASILNLSSRGLGLRAEIPPDRGSYVEITRGHHLIIARVVWVKDHRFGVLTQDEVPVDAVIGVSSTSGSSTCKHRDTGLRPERITTARSLERRYEANKSLGSAMEFVFVGMLGASAAMVGYNLVKQAVTSPLASIQSALVK